jgi:hypothetical protein
MTEEEMYAPCGNSKLYKLAVWVTIKLAKLTSSIKKPKQPPID